MILVIWNASYRHQYVLLCKDVPLKNCFQLLQMVVQLALFWDVEAAIRTELESKRKSAVNGDDDGVP